MLIQRIIIHNYRSIRHLEMDCQSLMVLLGPNNHGKSNLLCALEFALSTSAKPTESDFFAFRGTDSPLWVELHFGSLTANEIRTFLKYAGASGTFKFRKTATLEGEGKVAIKYQGYVCEPHEWWLKLSALDRLSRREDVEKEARAVPALEELLAGKGKLSKRQVEDFQSAYISSHRKELQFAEVLEDGPLLGRPNVAGGLFPDFYLVPAIRELSDETKVKNTTTFGRLLQRAVQEMASRDPHFIKIRDELGTLLKSLNDPGSGAKARPSQLAAIETGIAEELKAWRVKVKIEITPPELERLFELGTELYLDDGVKTLAEKKGHGLQRAVLFALVRSWAKALRKVPVTGDTPSTREASDSLIFAIEEPELFLHPHAQRNLASALNDIAQTAEHQVFVCTHSTHFVDLDQHKSIAIISKSSAEKGTSVRQCMSDIFAGDNDKTRKARFHLSRWVNPARAELFFAHKVILVEGETEAAVLPFLANQDGCCNGSYSVIDCGGKHNLPLYVRLLNCFAIPYVVVHDEDPLPSPLPDDDERKQAAQRLFARNTEIASAVDKALGAVEMLRPNFEEVAGVSKRQGEKKGKAFAALEHFAALPKGNVPAGLLAVIRSAYSAPQNPPSAG